jgi:hypothetical protein
VLEGLDYKPSFHPWDHDNRALLERWKRQDEPRYRESADATAGHAYVKRIS